MCQFYSHSICEYANIIMYTLFQKNIPNIFDCNLKKDYQILIIFAGIFTRRLAIKRSSSLSSHPTTVSALPGEIITNKILHFYSKWYHYLIQVMHKNTFCLHFDTSADTLSNCFVFQLFAVKLIKVLAHCTNMGTEMFPPFTDRGINNVLLQTPDFTIGCFLNS